MIASYVYVELNITGRLYVRIYLQVSSMMIDSSSMLSQLMSKRRERCEYSPFSPISIFNMLR